VEGNCFELTYFFKHKTIYQHLNYVIPVYSELFERIQGNWNISQQGVQLDPGVYQNCPAFAPVTPVAPLCTLGTHWEP
jgi:hypothetical protein